jgi:putative nucleic acid modification protein with dual OB domain
MLIRRRGMEIVVNHVTRMRGGHVCVAGLDREGRHVRPVLEVGRIRRSSTADHGGPFGLGAIVELGHPRPRPAPPEVEDCVFDPRSTRAKGMTDPTDFWRLLDELSSSSLREIFGGMLTPDGRTASMPTGTGTASLGVYKPVSSIRIDRSFGKLRVLGSDSHLGAFSLPLTDLRLYDFEADAVGDRRLELLEDRLRRAQVILSVGVSRPWAREGGEQRHWLQVNNVHLDDNPLWPN